MTQIDIAALVADLTTKSAMINMGEKIAWGSETALMDQAAAALIAQDAELKRYREALTEISSTEWQEDEPSSGWIPDGAEGYVGEMESFCNWAVGRARAALGEKP